MKILRGRRRLHHLAGAGSLAVAIVCGAIAVPAFGFAARVSHIVVVAQGTTGSAAVACPAG